MLRVLVLVLRESLGVFVISGNRKWRKKWRRRQESLWSLWSFWTQHPLLSTLWVCWDISFSSSPYLFFCLVSLPQNSGLGFGGAWDLVLGSRDFFGFILRGFSLALDTKEGWRRFFSASGGAGVCGWALLLLCCNRGSQTEVERSRFCTNLRKTSMECRSWREILLHTQPLHNHSICNWQQVCKQSLSFALLSCNLTYTHTFSCKASWTPIGAVSIWVQKFCMGFRV